MTVLTQLQSMHTSASSTLVEMALSTAKYNVAKASQLLRMSLDPPGGQKTAPAKVVKPGRFKIITKKKFFLL